jgi:hypothetical protein
VPNVVLTTDEVPPEPPLGLPPPEPPPPTVMVRVSPVGTFVGDESFVRIAPPPPPPMCAPAPPDTIRYSTSTSVSPA